MKRNVYIFLTIFLFSCNNGNNKDSDNVYIDLIYKTKIEENRILSQLLENKVNYFASSFSSESDPKIKVKKKEILDDVLLLYSSTLGCLELIDYGIEEINNSTNTNEFNELIYEKELKKYLARLSISDTNKGDLEALFTASNLIFVTNEPEIKILYLEEIKGIILSYTIFNISM
jgi:hypothetical protein